MLAAGCPVATLTETRRNSGEIVHQCQKIRAGMTGVVKTEGNVTYIASSSPDDITKLIVDHLAEFEDPVWDCQVIVPMNRGELGRTVLNPILQNVLNPNPQVSGTIFRVGDKVVCLKNSPSCLVVDETDPGLITGKTYVANGDVGEVEIVDSRWMTVRLSGPDRLVKIFRFPSAATEEKPRDQDAVLQQDDEASSTGCDWDLAYAISGHKSQGAEYPIAIVVIDAAAHRVCSREWLYTAMSRAKEHCYVFGRKDTMDQMIRKTSVKERKTFLAERVLKGTIQETSR